MPQQTLNVALALWLAGSSTVLALPRPQESAKQAQEDLATFGVNVFQGYSYDINPLWYYQGETPSVPGAQLAQDDWYTQCNASITSLCYNTNIFQAAPAGEVPDTNPASSTPPPMVNFAAPASMLNKWNWQTDPGNQCSIGYYLPSGANGIDSAYCVRRLQEMASGMGPERTVNASLNRAFLNIDNRQPNAFPTNSSNGAPGGQAISLIVQP